MSNYGRSPAMAAVALLREADVLFRRHNGIIGLGLLDMDAVGLEAARLSGVDPSWIRSAEQIKIYRRRSAAARKGWATRRALRASNGAPNRLLDSEEAREG